MSTGDSYTQPQGTGVAHEAYTQGLFEDMAETIVFQTGTLETLNEEVRRLREEARTDQLTGLLNARGLAEELTARVEQKRSFGIIAIDVNQFKKVNDTLGHHEGDELLRDIGQIVQPLKVRRDDRVGYVRDEITPTRPGGDEFIILVDLTDSTADSPPPPGHTEQRTRRYTPEEKLDAVRERIGRSFGTYKQTNEKVSDLPVGLAMGTAIWIEGMTIEELKQQADSKMYANKPDKEPMTPSRRLAGAVGRIMTAYAYPNAR